MAVLTKNGFGQVEPNHLSAQRTGQIYAQLPVEAETLVDLVTPGIVQNGMFLDYDYAKNSVVASPSGGSSLTMLVMNEIRTYADFLTPKDYAQIASGTPAGIGLSNEAPALFKSATLATIARAPSGIVTLTVTSDTSNSITTGSVISLSGLLTASGNDLSSLNGTFTIATNAGLTSTITTSATTTISTSTTSSNIIVYAAGTASFNTVYPRMYKISAGDIITTNLVNSSNGLISDFAIGDVLTPGVDGVLQKVASGGTQSVLFRVAAITTTPDLQTAVKLQCVKAG
jgi:hypothetical protein